ncbi:hypothetical protein SAMN04488023_10941 [Pedobacter rhizosphaerae]|uniref:Uncharacterized protein n=1 Tax=Pedobacter rhizosphaerae TaxID=390241 RepID=A0A1H9P567_9SPHI|nr:hypothetical protein SAMN04488023_10941 [Pedobacter rhizosphaerae]
MKKELRQKTILDLLINTLCGVVILLVITLGIQIFSIEFYNDHDNLKNKDQDHVKVVPTKSRLRLL